MSASLIYKTADRYSMPAKRILKRVLGGDAAIIGKLGLPQDMIKKIPRVQLQDIIRTKLFPKKFVGKDPGGYLYRAVMGDSILGHSGTEARLINSGKAKTNVLFMAANPGTMQNYQTLDSIYRIPVSILPKSQLNYRVTFPEGDPRGSLYRSTMKEFRSMPKLKDYARSAKVRKSMGSDRATEVILDKDIVTSSIGNSPKSVQKLPPMAIVSERGINHRALLDPKGNVIWSSVPLKPSLYHKYPILRGPKKGGKAFAEAFSALNDRRIQ